MKYKVNEIFKNENLSSEELAYWGGQLNEIDKDFSNGEFNFTKLKDNQSYYEVLIKYLEVNGYGFLSNKMRKEKSEVKLAKLLIDSNLIKEPLVTIDTNLKNEIVYDKEFGFKEKYYVKFNTKTFPFEITNIYYKENENLNCRLNRKSQKIEILIDIKENTEVDIVETIIVYTSLGLKEVFLSIKCNKNLNSEINISDFEEFKGLCETNIYKAKEIFENREFRVWLNKKGYVTQVLNYNEAFMLSTFCNNEFRNPFNNFCLLNGVYNEDNNIEEKIEDDYFGTNEEYEPKVDNDYEEVNTFERKDNTSKNQDREEEKDNEKEKTNKKSCFLSKIKGLFKKK